MPNMIDFFLKENIMRRCESVFNEYLKDQGAVGDTLTEEERELVGKQVDSLLDMVDNKYDKDNPLESVSEIVDNLVGHVVIAKMNEARLCRLLNELGG